VLESGGGGVGTVGDRRTDVGLGDRRQDLGATPAELSLRNSIVVTPAFYQSATERRQFRSSDG